MSNFVEKIFDFVIKYSENVGKYSKKFWGFLKLLRNLFSRICYIILGDMGISFYTAQISGKIFGRS